MGSEVSTVETLGCTPSLELRGFVGGAVRTMETSEEERVAKEGLMPSPFNLEWSLESPKIDFGMAVRNGPLLKVNRSC